jgi:hypothetical protein
MAKASVNVGREILQRRDHKTAKASSPDQDRPRGARRFLEHSGHQTGLWHFAPNMQTRGHTMINESHLGTTSHDIETPSDLDSTTIDHWAASLAKLLSVAVREADTASLLLRVQIERSSFDPIRNHVHLERDMDVNASVDIALTKFSRSPGMAKGFTLYGSRSVISSRNGEVVRLAKICLWR